MLDAERKRYQAQRTVVEPCCNKECLLSRVFDAGIRLGMQCQDELGGLGKKGKTSLLQKVHSCIVGKTAKENWRVPGVSLENVFRDCLCYVYCFAVWKF